MERRNFVGTFLRAVSDFRRNWEFVKWLTTTVPVANLRGQINPWLLAFFYGSSATGVYSACLNVTSLANPFLSGFGNIIGPMAAHSYARGRISGLRRYILRAHVPIGLGMAIFWVAMLIFGGRLVSLIYGDNYNGLGAVVSLLGTAIFVGALCIPTHRGLLAIESSRAVFISEFIPLILQISLGLWLVMNFQIWGAAAAILIGSIIEFAFLGVMFTKYVNSPGNGKRDPWNDDFSDPSK
jgi:O-antigen/teichoic acid export membrane protein